MKKKNIKKRLAALRSGLMLSLFVISPFSVFKASNFNVIVTNEYGSFTRGNWSASILNTTYSTSAVIGELNGVYNGRVTINYSTDPTTTDLLFIPINCSMESSSGNSITIIFKNVSSFMVLIDGSGADSLQVNSMTGWNMTKISDGTNTQLNSVLSYIDNIETLLTTNNTTLGLIYNYIQTLDTSNTDISIDVGDIQVDVNDIEVGIGDLLSAITSMITDGIDTITLGDILDQLDETNSHLSTIISRLQLIEGSLQSAVTHLSSISNNTNQINTNVQDIELIAGVINQNIVTAKNDIADLKTYINTIVTTLNNINNALSNIDNSIDTISWINLNESNITYSNDGINYDTGTGNHSRNTYYNLGNFNLTSLDTSNNRTAIFKITIPLGNMWTISKNNFKFYNLINDQLYEFNPKDIYISYSRSNIIFYITLYPNDSLYYPTGNNPLILLCTISSFLNFGNSKIEYIPQTDIEYWSLLNAIRTFNFQLELINQLNTLTPLNYNSKLNDIINAINNLEINYNVSTDIENNIETDVELINDIDTVINNEINVFNNNKDYILDSFISAPDLSELKTFMNRFIFTGEFGDSYYLYISMMLFMTFVLVLLG